MLKKTKIICTQGPATDPDGITDTAANAENVCSCTAHRRHECPLCHAFTSSHIKEALINSVQPS